jgi:hypothetical protein
LGKVRVWGPLGGSAFKYDARTKGGVVNPLEAFEFELFGVRGSCCLVITLMFEGLARMFPSLDCTVFSKALEFQLLG